MLGTINPIKDIIDTAHSHNVPVLIDGAQGALHQPVDVQALDVDFYVLSAHKMYGPTGIGILYGRKMARCHATLSEGGGEMIGHVTFEKTTFNELPFKFEAGTPDYIGTMAFARALDYIDSLGIENIAAHEDDLLRYTTRNSLMQIDGIRIYGTAPEKCGVISFLVRDIHTLRLMGNVNSDKLGFASADRDTTVHNRSWKNLVSSGRYGASFAVRNTIEECEAFVAAVKRVSQMF